VRPIAFPPARLCASARQGIGATATGFACILVLWTAGALNAAVATFEDLTLVPESYWNGDDGSGGFVSGDAFFTNHYDAEWGFWDGFARSNLTDANDMGYPAQYNAITGGGQGGSANYAVAYVGWLTPPTITLDVPQQLCGLYVTNNCYAYWYMRSGNSRFGGTTGDDSDWFLLTITGIDANDQPTGSVAFYLADFRFIDNARDYIVDSWAFVDLTALGEVKVLRFALSSNDNNELGMLTPGFVCIDTLVGEAVADPDAKNKKSNSGFPASLSGGNLWQGK